MVVWQHPDLAGLQAKYPDWDLWVVRVVVGPDTWCAKPRGAKTATCNRDSAKALDEWLAEQEAAKRGQDVTAL